MMPRETRTMTPGRTPYRIGVGLLSVYIGTTPIWWLPFLGVGTVSTAKAILAFVSVFAVLIEATHRNQLRIPPGLLGLPGVLILILLATSAILQAKSVSLSIAFVVQVILGFGTLWCFAILAREGADLPKLFLRALYIIAAACIFMIINELTGLYQLPAEWSVGPGTRKFGSSGLATRSTHWSNGLALFIPVVLLLFLKTPVTRYRVLAQLVLVVLIIGSQFVSGGRAGLASSVLIVISISIAVAIFIGSFRDS